jgi:hypothetical protein
MSRRFSRLRLIKPGKKQPACAANREFATQADYALGPILWRPAPGPGPPRPAQLEACSCETPQADGFAATVSAAATTQRGGMAVSQLRRPWGLAQQRRKVLPSFSDGPAHPRSYIPDPFLGSNLLRTRLPARSQALGPMPPELGVSHPAVGGITGGDSNPDRPSAFSRRVVVRGGLVAGRRLPPCPHLFASHG